MIKTHEIDIAPSKFNKLMLVDYVVLEKKTYEQNDYILFRETDADSTALRSQLTQIKEVINDEGIKDGYILAVINKI